MEGTHRGAEGTHRAMDTSRRNKAFGTLAVATTAFAGYVIGLPGPYLALVATGTLLAALLIGWVESEVTNGFVGGLAPGWIGFSLGTMLAFATNALLNVYVPFDIGQDLPEFAVNMGSLVFIGIPIGFITGGLGALVVYLRRWAEDRRGPASRGSEAAARKDDPEDPFGWRRHSGGQGGPGRP